MGCWGMGITQSDDYQDVYETFLEKYDEGGDISKITREILDQYLAEFDPGDGILHDVYFALAKAQWMCGGVQPEILAEVARIVDTGANVDFYRELEASESDLKVRQRNLIKFLEGLKRPRFVPPQAPARAATQPHAPSDVSGRSLRLSLRRMFSRVRPPEND